MGFKASCPNPSFELQQKTFLSSFPSCKFHPPCTVKSNTVTKHTPCDGLPLIERRAPFPSSMNSPATWRHTALTNSSVDTEPKREVLRKPNKRTKQAMYVYNVRVTTVSWKHGHELCVAELHEPVNSIQIFIVAQQCCYGELSPATMQIIRTSFWRKSYCKVQHPS